MPTERTLPPIVFSKIFNAGLNYWQQSPTVLFSPDLRASYVLAREASFYRHPADRLADQLFYAVLLSHCQLPSFLRETLCGLTQLIEQGQVDEYLFYVLAVARADQFGDNAYTQEQHMWTYEEAPSIIALSIVRQEDVRAALSLPRRETYV